MKWLDYVYSFMLGVLPALALSMLLNWLGGCSMETGPVDVELSAQALTQYTAINSNGGVAICPLNGSQCTNVGGASAMMRAIRSLSQSRHPSWGINTWSCNASGTEGYCELTSHTCEKMRIKQCNGNGICRFGSDNCGNWIDEGEAHLDLTNGQGGMYYFSNGGIGSSNYSGHTFSYQD